MFEVKVRIARGGEEQLKKELNVDLDKIHSAFD